MAAVGEYDLIVIGGGAIGLSTAYHAAKRNLKTLVLEQYGYFNDSGSSAGASRQFRLQYAVQYMSELCIASQPFWPTCRSRPMCP
jgi:glycine/D-amino acid oxidase-like deaminating enzyme